MSQQSTEKQVAPADKHYAGLGDQDRKPLPEGQGEGVHPLLTHPDQPTFPHPVGVDKDKLREAGLGHGYQGVGNEDQADHGQGVFVGDEDLTEQAERNAATVAPAGEGKPRDPEAERKQAEAAAAAAAAQQGGQPQGQPQGGQPQG